MKTKKWLIFMAFLAAFPAIGQLRDTILYSMTSRPFFYNVLKAGDGHIYAGTSEGVYEFDGAAMSRVDDRIGYLKGFL